MIRLDEIRGALSGVDPSDALDALVRRELAAGRGPREVYDEIRGMMPQVVALAEYRGEAEADFHGIMDALRGWCHPSCRYPGSPADRPTLSEIKPVLESALPRIEAIPGDGPAIAAAVRSLLAIVDPAAQTTAT